MMIASAIKKISARLQVETKFHPSDFSAKTPFPVRHLNFGFNSAEFNEKFYCNTEFATAYFECLSIFLTYGEELVIDAARYHRQFITDPVLKQRVTALIGQEAIHSKVHNEWNDTLEAHRIPVRLFRQVGDFLFGRVLSRLSPTIKLSSMAGIEHFTAVLAEYMMKHEHIFDVITSDEKTKAMWQWHMIEESEHKDVAYDVYQVLNGNYLLRIFGFVSALTMVVGFIPLMALAIPFFRNPQDALTSGFWKDLSYSSKLLFSRADGVYGSTMPHILDYLRRDFHPNDHDTADWMSYYKEKLLERDDGLLARYLTREFIPALKNA
jgi:predicted metal-dependent hydrolase